MLYNINTVLQIDKFYTVMRKTFELTSFVGVNVLQIDCYKLFITHDN